MNFVQVLCTGNFQFEIEPEWNPVLLYCNAIKQADK